MGDHEVILVLGVPEEKTRVMFRRYAPAGCEVVFSNGPEDLDGLLPDAHYIALWTAPLGSRELRAAKQLKYVQKVGEGTDRIDIETAKALGLMVAKTVRENSYSTAEITILLMLAVLRRLPEAHNSLVNGEWLKWPIREHTFELRNKVVGIVGLGKIGTIVAALANAFGAKVLYHNRNPLSADEERSASVSWRSLDDLLAESEIVSLLVPLTEDTRGLIGERELGLMRANAILVNTARGEVVDQAALFRALESRSIWGAGLDCFAVEPPAAGDPLFQLPNVVLTPHVGGVTEDSKVNLVKHSMANIGRVRSGQALDEEDIVFQP